MAMQLHFRAACASGDVEEESVGFVWTSRLRIAESRSSSTVLAPCMAVPPVIDTFVFAFVEFTAGEAC